MASSAWKADSLKAHNELRERHGAPPLTWSDECYAAAKRQADACQASGCLAHGNTEGPSGRHGQNAFFAMPAPSVQEAVEGWYDEMTDPGHDFNRDFQNGTGHFTQVVWAGSREVGVAKSADGQFVIANYFPAGNMMGTFKANVYPAGSPTRPSSVEREESHVAEDTEDESESVNRRGWCFWCRPGHGHEESSDEEEEHPEDEGAKDSQTWHQTASRKVPATGTLTATRMSPELEAYFADCPFPEFKQAAVDAFAGGGRVTVKRGVADMEVTTLVAGRTSSMSGSWG